MPVTANYPAFGLASLVRYPASPDPDQSTAQTVAVMRQYIADGSERPEVTAAAREAAGALGMWAPVWRKCQAVHDWMRRNIRFVTDEEQLSRYLGIEPDYELLIRPELLVRSRRGDCDDFTMLTCAMLRALGVDTQICTIAADRRDPQRFSHVYAIALSEDGSPIAMDTSHGPYVGWEAPAFRRQVWPS